MENNGCTFRTLTDEEVKKMKEERPKREEQTTFKVGLSRERQEEIKRLMFSALEDPREKYEKITTDDMVKEWDRQGC
jgi:hypothetical protein